MTTPRQSVADSANSGIMPRPREAGPWYRRIGGLHVLKLTGSYYDMGRQHGALLKDEIPRGPLPYYRTYIERLVGHSGFGPLAPLACSVLQRLVGSRVIKAFPDFALETFRGLADGADLDLDSVLESCSMPDSLLWVASRVMRLKGVGPAMHHRLALGLGCTSAIAWGDSTADGKLLHGRNMDYHGVGCWPRTSAVLFHEPTTGLRYVSVGAAGVMLGGITAMNEAGLTLTVHQHMFTDRAALGGVPIGCVGDLVMRQASTLEEAEAILQAHRPIGCWTYLIADSKRRELLCWEENPERQAALRPATEQSTFGYTNIFLDEQLGDSEMNLYPSYWRHNLGRQQRVTQLLADRSGSIKPNDIASFLADPGQHDCRISTAIGMLMNVSSVVFRPEDGIFWVASGETPISENPYIPFDLESEDHSPEHGQLDGGVPADEQGREAFDHYRRAYLAYVDQEDAATSRRLIDRACELAPDQPLYHFLAGMLALKLGDTEAAFASLSRTLDLGHPHTERVATFHLWRARAADLRGERAQGLRDYRAVLGHHSDATVRAAAHKGLRRPYQQRQARRVDPDFIYADVIAP